MLLAGEQETKLEAVGRERVKMRDGGLIGVTFSQLLFAKSVHYLSNNAKESFAPYWFDKGAFFRHGFSLKT